MQINTGMKINVPRPNPLPLPTEQELEEYTFEDVKRLVASLGDPVDEGSTVRKRNAITRAPVLINLNFKQVRV